MIVFISNKYFFSIRVKADAINSTDFVTTLYSHHTIGIVIDVLFDVPGLSVFHLDWNNDGIYDQIGVSGPASHDFGTADTYDPH